MAFALEQHMQAPVAEAPAFAGDLCQITLHGILSDTVDHITSQINRS
jgi:hypothetical protein